MSALVIVTLAPGAALAKGTFKGTYGAEKFKSKKFVVLCAYTRSIGFFSIGGTQASKKKQKFATVRRRKRPDKMGEDSIDVARDPKDVADRPRRRNRTLHAPPAERR